jgi:hypothetical protein
MAADNHSSPRPSKPVDSPECGDDPKVVSHYAVVERDVEVGSNQDPSSVYIQIIEGQIGICGHEATLATTFSP